MKYHAGIVIFSETAYFLVFFKENRNLPHQICTFLNVECVIRICDTTSKLDF